MACSDPNMDVDRPHSDDRELAGLLELSDVEFDGLFNSPLPFPPNKTQPTPILTPSQIIPAKQPTFTLDLNPSPSPSQSTPHPMSNPNQFLTSPKLNHHYHTHPSNLIHHLTRHNIHYLPPTD